MTIGDLVRHRFDGRYDEFGIITEVNKCVGVHPGGMVHVQWCVERTHRNDRLYRMRDLEVVSANR